MSSKFPRVYVYFIIKNTILIKHVQMSSRVHLPGKPSRTSALRGDLSPSHFRRPCASVLHLCCRMPVTHLFISPSPDCDILQGRQESSMTLPQHSSFPMMSTQSKVMNLETSNDASSRVRQLPTRSLACSVITGDP